MTGGREDETDLRGSNPGSRETASGGGTGASSEWPGHAGPDQVAADGMRDTSADERVPDAEAPPEQREGLPEPKPANEDVPHHRLHHRNPGHSHG